MPPSLFARVASAAVIGFVRNFPGNRGKWRVLRSALGFLVVEFEPGLYLRVSDESDTVGLRIVRHGSREPKTISLIRELIKPGMVVVDAGANIGEYTILAASLVGDRGHVHAFEPTPKVIDELHRNVDINGLTNVTVNAVALATTAGTIDFFVDPDEPDTNSMLRPSAEAAVIRIPAVTLDEYLERAKAAVDIIKMDIEGAEMIALRGALRTLTRTPGPLLVIEANDSALAQAGGSTGELLAFLREHKYRCYEIDSHGVTERYSNVLAVREDHPYALPSVAGLRPLGAGL